MIVLNEGMLMDAAMDAGLEEQDVRLDYSGRGMYGATCVGVVVDNVGDLVRYVTALSQYMEEADLDPSDLDEVSEDSMGRSRIYYWRHIKSGDENKGDE